MTEREVIEAVKGIGDLCRMAQEALESGNEQGAAAMLLEADECYPSFHRLFCVVKWISENGEA